MNKLASKLKEAVDTKGYIDVGSGVEEHLGVSKEEMVEALSILEKEGYVLLAVIVNQLGAEENVLVKLLASPGTTYKDIVVKMK